MRQALLPALLALSIPAAADAESCGERDAVLGYLQRDWGERVLTQALAEDGSIIETLVAPNTRTWTVIRTTADGVSCLLLSGGAFDIVAAPPGIEG